SISIAGLRGRLRDSATMGVEQNRPYLTPEVAKRALVVASARSHAATNWQPAAAAMPSTSATTGCGSRVSESIILLHAPNSSSSFARSRSFAISLRSWPAQNARPLPVITTTRTAGSSLIRSSSAWSRPRSSRESALYCSGRFRVRPTTPSASLRSSTGSGASSSSRTASSTSAASAIASLPIRGSSGESYIDHAAPAQTSKGAPPDRFRRASARRGDGALALPGFDHPVGVAGGSGGEIAGGGLGALRFGAGRALQGEDLAGDRERVAFDRHVLAPQAHAPAEVERNDDAEQRPEAVGHQLVGARDLGKAQGIKRRQHEEGANAERDQRARQAVETVDERIPAGAVVA